MSFGAFRFNRLGGGAKMPRQTPFFLLLRALAENILVLRVGLREVVVTKALPKFQLATAFSVALDDQLDSPFDFGGRALSAAAEILVVLDLELANISLELT